MKQVIGTKHRSTNAQWLDAVANIESLISREEVDRFAETALERIASATRGRNVAFAYSAGKDSIVLADLCSKLGIRDGYLAYCSLDYPAFLKGVRV